VQDPNPAFVLYDSEAQDLERYLWSTGTPFQSFRVQQFVVFYGLSNDVVGKLHREQKIPAL
jgi:hypothetical protein